MSLWTALTRRPRRQPVPPPPPPAPKPLPAAAPLLALPPPRPEPEPPQPRYDLRRVSPRRFAEIAHELYLEGMLGWEEYQQVGFPTELHPDYAATIGALTGERADPDRPRDMLGAWEKRVEFLRRFDPHAFRPAMRAVEKLSAVSA